MRLGLLLILLGAAVQGLKAPSDDRPRLREFGLRTGVLTPGPLNAITDVAGVKVGHTTIIQGQSVRTGVTAILPHEDNVFQDKVAGAVAVANGFGKLIGITQVQEMGTIETPIVLTNTLSVPAAAEAVIEYTLSRPGNEAVESVNAVVGETNDGYLNDIRGRHVRKEHVLEAIAGAAGGPVEEGCVGAGTGTICYGFKGGIGTSSRRSIILRLFRKLISFSKKGSRKNWTRSSSKIHLCFSSSLMNWTFPQTFSVLVWKRSSSCLSK